MTGNVADRLKDAFEDALSNKKRLIRILSVVLILLAAIVLRLYDSNKADVIIESPDTAEESEYADGNTAPEQSIFVDIGGEVEDPGVYEVSKDTRLFQVIEMAGGLTENADADHVNRASFVEDGQKIVIPVKGSANAGGDPPASEASSYADSGLININTATADELKTLNGIGDVMAGRIIEYRSSRAFKNIEDIMSVDGIGSRTYEKIKDHITV